jgi:phage shock protein A
VAEDPDQIRQAIEETRADIADTVQALVEKADVKERIGHTVTEKTSEMRSRASELQESALGALPPSAQSKAAEAVDSVQRAVGMVASDPAKKRAVMWGAGALTILLLLRRRRR